jgi:tetratricopeptide (TPR) repeat protein
MADDDSKRARLIRALIKCKTTAEVGRRLRAYSGSLDGVLARALFHECHRLLLQRPIEARSAVRALEALTRITPSPEVRAWSQRAKGTSLHVEGRSREAVALLEQASKRLRETGSSAEAGDVQRVLIDVYAILGRDALARRAAERAVACYGRDVERRSRRLADVEMNLGGLHHMRDRWNDALRCYERAEELYASDHDPARVGKCLANQALILAILDRQPAARERYQRALACFETAGHEAEARICNYHLSELDMSEGALDRALTMFARLKVSSAAAGNTEFAGLCLLASGEAALQANLLSRAFDSSMEALAVFQALRYPNQVSQALGVGGSVLARQGDLRRAKSMIRKAVRLQSKLGNRVGEALHLCELARIELHGGRRSMAALHARRAARALEHAGSASRLSRALTLVARAELAASLTRRGSRVADRAVTVARQSRDLRAQFESFVVRGQAARLSRDPKAAYRWLKRAERLVEKMRLGLTRDESRIAFSLDKMEVYEELVLNRLDLGTAKGVREALHYAERAKARALAETLASGRMRETLGTNAAEAQSERFASLESALASAEQRLVECSGPSGIRRAFGERVLALTRQRREFLEALAVQNPTDALLAGLAPHRPLDALDTLRREETILEYFSTGDALHLFLVTREQVQVFPAIASVEKVSGLVQRLRFHLGKEVFGDAHHARFGAANGRACRHYLQQLHEQLLAPVISELNERFVRVVPHGSLHGLPFHALEKDGRPLIDRCVVSYSPSLAVAGMLDQRRAATPDAPALVLGVPDHAAPAIEAEVAAIGRRLPSAEVKTGSAVTRDALTRGATKRPITHVACHGFYHDGDAMSAGLRLGDTWLDLADVYALPESSPLMVLSGCETGRGTTQAGDEWVGLVSGFLRAGSRTVVAALWGVHDASTVSLMDDFYSELASGTPAAVAMAHAQRRARSNDASPLRWAPFAVVGDPFYSLPAEMVASSRSPWIESTL